MTAHGSARLGSAHPAGTLARASTVQRHVNQTSPLHFLTHLKNDCPPCNHLDCAPLPSATRVGREFRRHPPNPVDFTSDGHGPAVRIPTGLPLSCLLWSTGLFWVGMPIACSSSRRRPPGRWMDGRAGDVGVPGGSLRRVRCPPTRPPGLGEMRGLPSDCRLLGKTMSLPVTSHAIVSPRARYGHDRLSRWI